MQLCIEFYNTYTFTGHQHRKTKQLNENSILDAVRNCSSYHLIFVRQSQIMIIPKNMT